MMRFTSIAPRGKIALTTRRCLSSSKSIPKIGLGTWKSEPNQVKHAVKYAIQNGYRHIDCAAVYKNEREVGQGVAEALSATGLKREDIFVTSKLWNTEHAVDRIRTACEQTIHDLGVSYLDSYLMHWPVSFRPGNGTHPTKSDGTADFDQIPLWETWEAMQDLVEEGLVKSLGVSNFTVELLQDLIDDTDIVPHYNQVELHPYLQQPELVAFCKKHNIQLTAYSPLGTGTVNNREKLPVLLEDPVLVKMAQKYGKTPAQIALRWSVQKGFVPLPKSVTPARIQENYGIFDFEISEADMQSIANLNSNTRYVCPPWSVFAQRKQ